jgi:sialic acid synthase SpsE
MKATCQIFGKTVGIGQPCFVVAEAGSNHNGSFETALRLIDAAADAGADAVKFQTFEAKRLYPKSAGRSDYLKNETPIFDIIKAMEMPAEWLPKLCEHAHARGLAFISSPFHEEAVALLDPYVDAFKIASYELTHEPLLAAVAGRHKPVILSTGASTVDEARRARDVLERAGCNELLVLQCTASYPTPLEAANVRALVTLREALGVPTGLSDHTRDPTVAPMTAAALSAAMIEKHFTLSNRLPGPDHAFAVEPDELALLVRRVREVETVVGTGTKEVHAVEHELRSFARRSVFTTRAIRNGERFTRDNVDILRHGKLASGLAPSELERVLGAVAARDLPAETPVQEADLRER